MTSKSMFTPNETAIGVWNAASPGTPPPSAEDRLYILSIDPDQKPVLQIYFSERPKSPDTSKDDPLCVRIPVNCRIILQLDPGWNWEFRQPPVKPADDPGNLGAITVNQGVTGYYNLEYEVLNGKCRRVSFFAQYRSGIAYQEGANFDSFNIYLLIDKANAGVNEPAQLAVRLDPDIQNPGNPPGFMGKGM